MDACLLPAAQAYLRPSLRLSCFLETTNTISRPSTTTTCPPKAATQELKTSLIDDLIRGRRTWQCMPALEELTDSLAAVFSPARVYPPLEQLRIVLHQTNRDRQNRERNYVSCTPSSASAIDPSMWYARPSRRRRYSSKLEAGFRHSARGADVICPALRRCGGSGPEPARRALGR